MINYVNIICFIAGMILSGIIFLVYTTKLKNEIRAVKRQYEKKSVGMDDSSLKIKTLESKIKTLESALKKQIPDSDDR